MIEQLAYKIPEFKEDGSNLPTEQVDWGYHCIKYHVYYYTTILSILNSEERKYDEIYMSLKTISIYKIKNLSPNKFFKYLRKYELNDKMDGFPLCIISDNPHWKGYSDKIEQTMKKVQKCILTEKVDELNVYESIILVYMIELETNKHLCETAPMDIYQITHFFQDTSKEKELLDKLVNVKKMVNNSQINKYENVHWNIYKHIALNGQSEYFKLKKLNFAIIGSNTEDVIHIVLKSNISKLNYWDTMVEIVLERFLISNPENEKDKKKFKDKNINTYLFNLDKNNIEKIDWDCKSLEPQIRKEIKNALIDYYSDNHKDIYDYFDFTRKNSEKDIYDVIGQIITEIVEKGWYPDYIKRVFMDIQTKIEENEGYEYINDFHKMNNKLNKKLEIFVNKYLDIKCT